MKARVTISISESLLEDIDNKKGRYSRSQFIEDMLRGVSSLSEEKEEVVSGYVWVVRAIAHSD